jgi:hypothetical protein
MSRGAAAIAGSGTFSPGAGITKHGLSYATYREAMICCTSVFTIHPPLWS